MQKTEQKSRPDYNNLAKYRNHTEIDKFDISMISDLKKLAFNADLGHFFTIAFMNDCHARRIKAGEIGNLLGIKDQGKQFEKTQELVTEEFESVKGLSMRIDDYLAHRNSPNKSSSSEANPYKNIKSNYLLQYYQTKIDPKYGCYLFHEPILTTLDELIKKGNLSYEQKIHIMGDILDAMEFLQELRICHRNISSYAFVFVSRAASGKRGQAVCLDGQYDEKNWVIKLTSFYQSICVTAGKQKPQDSKLYFENIYTDPNIVSFQKPEYASDLWSVIVLFYELLTGELPNLSNKSQLDEQMEKLLSWQKSFFSFYFRGTKEVKITLKDIRMKVKNMAMTSGLTQCILQECKQMEASRVKLKKLGSLQVEVQDSKMGNEKTKAKVKETDAARRKRYFSEYLTNI